MVDPIGIQELRKITNRSYEFSQEVRAEGIANLDLCYQCSICSDGCPVAHIMDYYPHQLIHMVKVGLKKDVLRSRAIWLCTSCQTCATRCPNEIDIVHLMDVLRKASIREGFENDIDRIPRFHKTFVDEVQQRGRIHGLRLVLLYKLKTGDFLSFQRTGENIKLGLKMFSKGKFKMLSQKISGQKDFRQIFRRVLREK